MEGHVGELLAVSSRGATRSREWMYRVITLLEAALGQLHNPVHPAQGTLREAVSLLRQQTRVKPGDQGWANSSPVARSRSSSALSPALATGKSPKPSSSRRARSSGTSTMSIAS